MIAISSIKRILYSGLLLALCTAVNLTVQAQSLQAINDAAKGSQEVAVGPKVYVADQARMTFQAAWKEFRETHTYNLDGEFETGGTCEDTHDTLDAFYIHLSTHRLTKTIHFMQRCSLCSGSGKFQTSINVNTGNNNCPNCRGSGREEAANTYTFLVLPINVPAKPETPRQKQEKALRSSVTKELADLELQHSVGDVDASLRLGKIYAEGYHFILKDVPKSESYFLKAMTLGSEGGIPGYLIAREDAFKGGRNDAILIYALHLARPDLPKTKNTIQLSYTEHLIAQAISERTIQLIKKSRLTREDLRMDKLRGRARMLSGGELIENSHTLKINNILQEFFASDRPPRITGVNFRKLRGVAIAKGNGAFGMLGDFIQNGEGPTSTRNAQAAHIYYNLEYMTSGDPYALECARIIEDSIDPKTTAFFLNEYRRLAEDKSTNDTTLLAVDEMHTFMEIIK
jgi:hypothetical protein